MKILSIIFYIISFIFFLAGIDSASKGYFYLDADTIAHIIGSFLPFGLFFLLGKYFKSKIK